MAKSISWVAQMIAAVILLQSLYFKFTDATETIALFEQLGMGAFGYKLIGSLELAAGILLLTRGFVAWGALLAWGLMSGALLAHLTKIGFQGDYALLGAMAGLVWILSIMIICIRRSEVPFLRSAFNSKK